jgi:hypothetical protein
MVGVSGIVGSDRMVDRYSVHLSEGSADADARVCLYGSWIVSETTRAKKPREDRASNLLLGMMETSRSWRGLLGAGAECRASLRWAFAYS